MGEVAGGAEQDEGRRVRDALEAEALAERVLGRPARGSLALRVSVARRRSRIVRGASFFAGAAARAPAAARRGVRSPAGFAAHGTSGLRRFRPGPLVYGIAPASQPVAVVHATPIAQRSARAERPLRRRGERTASRARPVAAPPIRLDAPSSRSRPWSHDRRSGRSRLGCRAERLVAHADRDHAPVHRVARPVAGAADAGLDPLEQPQEERVVEVGVPERQLRVQVPARLRRPVAVRGRPAVGALAHARHAATRATPTNTSTRTYTSISASQASSAASVATAGIGDLAGEEPGSRSCRSPTGRRPAPGRAPASFASLVEHRERDAVQRVPGAVAPVDLPVLLGAGSLEAPDRRREVHRAGYSVLTAWPPNSLRSAASTLAP